MSWSNTVDQLEVVLFASLFAFFVMTVVASVVGTLTYLVTRDPAFPTPAGHAATPKVMTGREAYAAEAATAIAG